MSQYGAQGFAAHGWSYRQILAYYYPGTSLARRSGTHVRVLLADGRPRVVVSSARPFRVNGRRLPAGRYGLGPALRIDVKGKPLELEPPLRFEPGSAPLALDGLPYRGELTVFASGGGVAAVDRVSLEDYVRGVVPWEMPWFWRQSALRAQAVAARSYAVATLAPDQSFDAFADTRSQAYGGIRSERAATDAAVAATAGQIVTWRGRVAETFYFSSSGGRTAAAADGLPHAPALPYLRSVADPYDAISPHHTWGPVVVQARTVARKLGLGCVPALSLVANASGRVSQVRARCPRATRTVSGGRFERELGLRSTWFSVTETPAKAAPPALAPQAIPRPPELPEGPGWTGRWPEGKHAWTVVLDSLPESSGVAAARRDMRQQTKAGLPNVGVLHSSDFPNLRGGLYVVFSGVYRTAAEATAAAARADRGYPREIVP
jgi:stage II sporulation protein D